MMTTRKQTAPYGYILTNGEVFSFEIYLPAEAQDWEVIINTGQLDDPREPEPEAVPPIITQLQGKLQLDLMQLYGQVEAMINQSGTQAKIYWNTASNWERNSPILNRLAPLIWPDDTDSQLDQFFKNASKLN